MSIRRIQVLSTGGTIATERDASSGVATIVGVNKLVSGLMIPGVDLQFLEVFRKGSAEITPDDWLALARGVAINLRRGVDGIIILHGTDTMQYTAAVLSFMIQGLSVPVVFTGSMIPGNEPNSDSMSNLRAAIRVAAFADLAEVCVVFSADESGRNKIIIRGTRAKKVSSMALNAFASINMPALGGVADATIELGPSHVTRSARELSVRTSLNSKVGLIKCSPSLTKQQRWTILSGLDGAVLEGTGIGHVRSDLHESIIRFAKPTVISTQCVYGGERLGTYDIDKKILEIPNVITSGDMIPEVALAKLMWVLSQTSQLHRVRNLMRRPMVGEIS